MQKEKKVQHETAIQYKEALITNFHLLFTNIKLFNCDTHTLSI